MKQAIVLGVALLTILVSAGGATADYLTSVWQGHIRLDHLRAWQGLPEGPDTSPVPFTIVIVPDNGHVTGLPYGVGVAILFGDGSWVYGFIVPIAKLTQDSLGRFHYSLILDGALYTSTETHAGFLVITLFNNTLHGSLLDTGRGSDYPLAGALAFSEPE